MNVLLDFLNYYTIGWFILAFVITAIFNFRTALTIASLVLSTVLLSILNAYFMVWGLSAIGWFITAMCAAAGAIYLRDAKDSDFWTPIVGCAYAGSLLSFLTAFLLIG